MTNIIKTPDQLIALILVVGCIILMCFRKVRFPLEATWILTRGTMEVL